MKIKVSLNIGFQTANRKSIIDIPDEQWYALENDDEREEIMEEYAEEWAFDKIKIDWKRVDSDE